MECQGTTKTLKINKNKVIGTVVVVVEGEDDEFRLLKKIFTEILDYNYVSLRRGRVIRHEFKSKINENCTVIVANTNSSSIKSIIDDSEYKDKLYNLLNSEYDRSLKNVPIYIIWDRDKDKVDDDKVQEYYVNAIDTFHNAIDNGYEMNGLLLLSYPCHESYILSNFSKQFHNNNYSTSQECKKDYRTSRFKLNDLNEKTLLLAVWNMHQSLLNYDIRNYDPSDFKHVNEIVYRKEEECFEDSGYFNALSLISIMLIDLGIIYEEQKEI